MIIRENNKKNCEEDMKTFVRNFLEVKKRKAKKQLIPMILIVVIKMIRKTILNVIKIKTSLLKTLTKINEN